MDNGELPRNADAEPEALVSDWLRVTQAQVNAFADATNDHQFIHVDPVRAARETAFGGTIAHGFLVLSMLSNWSYEVLPPRGDGLSINYGFDRIRFLAPVLTGSLVRGVFRAVSSSRRGETDELVRYQVTVETEQTVEQDPVAAILAEWLVLYRDGQA